MPEKETTKNLGRVIKGADKLIRDVQKDVGEIVDAMSSLKATWVDIKKRIKKPENGKGDEA